MMVVDASAIVSILKKEPGCQEFGDELSRRRSFVATPTMLEIKMALSSAMNDDDADRLVTRLLGETEIEPVDFTPAMVDVAVRAFRTFGKGRGHPAKLNFGDCMSYAVARVLDVPLLYKGADFARTDIRSALAS